MPQPSIKSPFRIDPTSGLRLDQPNFSAPSFMHSTRWREVNGRLLLGSFGGSLIRRSCTGSILSLIASSSMADSSPYIPGTVPGQRIAVGEPTLRLTTLERTIRLGVVYITGVAMPQ